MANIAFDSNGDYYLTGRTYGNIEGMNFGDYDSFLIKLSSDGTEKWRRQIGGSDFDEARDVVVDSSGNPYICGNTSSDLVPPMRSKRQMFCTRFDSNGMNKKTWVLGDSSMEYDLNSIDIDSSGVLYFTGLASGMKGINTFVYKFNPTTGKESSAYFGSSLNWQYGIGIKVSLTGEIYISGTTDFDPFIPKSKAFVMKLRPDFSVAWTNDSDMNTGTQNYAHDLVRDAKGNIFSVGMNVEYPLGTMMPPFTESFVAKLDESNGMLRWFAKPSRPVAFKGSQISLSVTIDAKGHIYAAGMSERSAADVDIFLVKFEDLGLTGNEASVKRIGMSTGRSIARNVVLDSRAGLLIVGDTNVRIVAPKTTSDIDFFALRMPLF